MVMPTITLLTLPTDKPQYFLLISKHEEESERNFHFISVMLGVVVVVVVVKDSPET